MGDPTNNRFYREPLNAPHSSPHGSYRDEFNTTADYDNGYRSAVRLARVLMDKHWPEVEGWEPAPDLLGVITQLDHITAHLHGCFAGPFPEPIVSMPPAADDGAPCALADRVGTSAATDAQVEVAARAIAEARHGLGVWNERNMNEVEQNDFRHQARSALQAIARLTPAREDRGA